jgi:transcriptional regulator with XRE-family HTH domain
LDAGLTQAEVAEICAMDRTTLSYIENEKHNVTIDMMDRMAKAVGKELWKLLK